MNVLTQDGFEELARAGERVDESLRLEFLDGKIVEKAAPDGCHGRIIAWLTRLCIQADASWWLYPDQGLRMVATVPFGKTVTLPEPVRMELDTEPLRNWVR